LKNIYITFLKYCALGSVSKGSLSVSRSIRVT